MVDCSDEGCAKGYGLLIEDLLSDYVLIESDAERGRLAQLAQYSGIPKTLARHGSLDEYVDSLPAYEQSSIEDKMKTVTEIRQCGRWIDRRDNVVMVLNVRDFDVTFETRDGNVRTMSKEKFLKEYEFIGIQGGKSAQTLGELKDSGYQDWLKRRNRMNGEIMYYKRYQMEMLKKYSYILVGLMGFLYLVFR